MQFLYSAFSWDTQWNPFQRYLLRVRPFSCAYRDTFSMKHLLNLFHVILTKTLFLLKPFFCDTYQNFFSMTHIETRFSCDTYQNHFPMTHAETPFPVVTDTLFLWHLPQHFYNDMYWNPFSCGYWDPFPMTHTETLCQWHILNPFPVTPTKTLFQWQYFQSHVSPWTQFKFSSSCNYASHNRKKSCFVTFKCSLDSRYSCIHKGYHHGQWQLKIRNIINTWC